LGRRLSIQASSFADNAGGSPCTGQFFIAIDPSPFAGAGFAAGIEQLLSAMTAQEGITIREALHERLLGYCNG
jgi:(2R)-3-sulfolactate dehydrogenase (NADP+)